MKYLLLLSILVLVVCLLNSKDLMNSDLVKSVTSKSKSLKMDNTTMLVLGFVVIVLFVCMSKGIEGFKLVETDILYDDSDSPTAADPKFDGVCPSNSTIKRIKKVNEGGGDSVVFGLKEPNGPGQPSDPPHPYGASNEDFGYSSPDLNKHLYGCLSEGGSSSDTNAWKSFTGNVIEEGTAGNNSSDYCSSVLDTNSDKICSRLKSRDCNASWSTCDANCTQTYTIISQESGGTACEATNNYSQTCSGGQCLEDVDCIGEFVPATCGEDCGIRKYNIISEKVGNGERCPHTQGFPLQCNPGEGACPPDIDCVGSWGKCQANCNKYYNVTTESSGNGSPCQHNNRAIQRCSPGQGNCRSVADVAIDALDEAARVTGRTVADDLVSALVYIVNKYAKLPKGCNGTICPRPNESNSNIGECYDPNKEPPVCTAVQGDCPADQINCSGTNDFGGLLNQFISKNSGWINRISGLSELQPLRNVATISEDKALVALCTSANNINPENNESCPAEFYGATIYMKDLLKSSIN
jgi:hypothetical protein